MNPNTLKPSDISPQIVRLLPEEFIRKHTVLPIKLDNDRLEVACCENKNNLSVLSEIHLITGFEVKQCLFTEFHIQELIDVLFSVEKNTKQILADMRIKEKKETHALSQSQEITKTRTISTDQPII